MAVGITQPGGAGTTIFFQTDTSAPNGLYYRAQDFAAAFPADFQDLGTFRKSYRSLVSVQNGDGVLTGTTTWKDSRCDVYFDTGKTYLVSSVGLANRYTEWGLVATSANGESIGYDGMSVHFGTNPFSAAGAFGNGKFYDCKLTNQNAAAATSRIFLSSGLTPNQSDILDTTVFTLLGLQAFGTTGTAAIGRMRRVNSIGLGSGIANGHVVQFNCPDSDSMNFYWPNGDRKISTSGYVRIANPKFFGPSTNADTRLTVAGILLNPEWSQNVVKDDFANFREEWLSFGVLVTDGNGSPLSGCRVELYDEFDGRYVIDTTTGSLGTIDFLAPQSIAEFGFGPSDPYAPFRNAVLVNGHNNDGVQHDHYPFILYVNRGQSLALYPQVTQKISPSYSTFLGTMKQWNPMSLQISLGSPSGVATTWIERSVP